MPRRAQYVPKHRGPAPEPVLAKGVRKTVLFSGVAVAATGFAVTSGVLPKDDAVGDSVEAASRATPQLQRDITSGVGSRELSLSRSTRRTAVDPDKRASLDRSSGREVTRTETLADADPRDIARAMLPEFGFSSDQFACLDSLYVSESDWDPTADNPSSSAYGIPQALTETHDDLPADYMTNPASQIRWGLGYIRSSYGTPCSAWEFKQANNWY